MGVHRIEIQMTGGHGCDRAAAEGEARTFCGLPSCPDCVARELVARFEARGAFGPPGSYARITHWPGEPGEVVDDLLAGTRERGSFR